jgi:hypothetical protein
MTPRIRPTPLFLEAVRSLTRELGSAEFSTSAIELSRATVAALATLHPRFPVWARPWRRDAVSGVQGKRES